jgi:hypothetical protein
MRAVWIAGALALAGCQVAAGFHAHGGSAPASSSPSTATEHPVTQPVNIGGPDPALGSGPINRAQLESLRGLTVEQARDRLRSFGHRGAVEVVQDTQFHEKCALDTVCFTEPVTGMPCEGAIVLWFNPKITIAPPPP